MLSRARGSAKGAAGFSLIELLTTMSVLVILLVIASPGLASLASSNALAAAQGEFAAAITLARGEAMKRGVPVGLAAIAPSGGAEFSGGWNVFVDANGNGQFNSGETIVRQQPAMSGDVTVSTGGTTLIAFNGKGFLTPSSLVSVRLCARGSSKGFLVRIEPVGLTDVSEITSCP